MSDQLWYDAMNWWNNAPEKDLIRNAANNRLAKLYTGTGQGISSSDTSHAVFSMYREWLHFVTYCEDKGADPKVVDFLIDYATP